MNKRTFEAKQTLERLNFDPIAALVECHREAKKIYDGYGTIYTALCQSKEASGNPFPVEDKAHVYLKIACDAARDLAGYVVPKLKAIEHVKANPLEGVSDKDKLEAMKQAVKLLEEKIAGGPVVTNDAS